MAKPWWVAAPLGEFKGIALSLSQGNVGQSHGLKGELPVTINIFTSFHSSFCKGISISESLFFMS
jgi:hypothetical protein